MDSWPGSAGAVPFVDLEGLPELEPRAVEAYLNVILERCAQAYDRKSEVMGEDLMGAVARYVLLDIMDTHWRDQLLGIDELRQGISLRSYGQRDPLIEYQREATEMFEDMMDSINREIFEKIYRYTLVREPAPQASRVSYTKEEGRQSAVDAARSAAAASQGGEEGGAQQQPHRPATYRRAQPKIGPNDPCPCGSGKKYKKCCGSPAAHQRIGVGGGPGEQA